jgi:hypothetical protein
MASAMTWLHHSNAQPRIAAVSMRPAGLVDHTGNMRLPIDYRTAYQFLGAWAVAADAATGSKEFHNVYDSPGAIDTYRINGRFADGTVLVKEVMSAETQDMTTGTVSRASTVVGWFMMVKDSRDSYPSNTVWGDGWGWAWFDKDSPSKTAMLDYKQECLSCHIPAQQSDWIYKDGCPALAS